MHHLNAVCAAFTAVSLIDEWGVQKPEFPCHSTPDAPDSSAGGQCHGDPRGAQGVEIFDAGFLAGVFVVGLGVFDPCIVFQINRVPLEFAAVAAPHGGAHGHQNHRADHRVAIFKDGIQLLFGERLTEDGLQRAARDTCKGVVQIGIGQSAETFKRHITISSGGCDFDLFSVPVP